MGISSCCPPTHRVAIDVENVFELKRFLKSHQFGLEIVLLAQLLAGTIFDVALNGLAGERDVKESSVGGTLVDMSHGFLDARDSLAFTDHARGG